MKKVLMLLTLGTVLMSAVPSVWATNPTIKVQTAPPAPSLLSLLSSIF